MVAVDRGGRERGLVIDGVRQLIDQLDADSTDAAMDAQVELIRRGHDTDVVEPLVRALATLSRYGQLLAIEILEELDDHRADRPLVGLLDSEHDTVREWAAGVLGRRRVHSAVPAVSRAYRASLARRDPPDGSEPVVLRQTLTDLGARHPVVPPLTAGLQTSAPNGWPVWPTTRLLDVVDDLADHNQVTLYFQLWRVESDGSMFAVGQPLDDTTLDFDQPWPVLVEQARDRAVGEARQVQARVEIVAAIEWIDQTDVLGAEPDRVPGGAGS
ncbi:HEAT repeat domain-containing protein [Actinokineospora pegani]|uniref:HEAT repeat domain-containing protein n=1 Tax=Actinokineospora pegani TaxID=2654637 RepID=UPI0012EAB04A|nr:HEAT repeat domain-containing protein [Actinokineospora pegani]